MVLALTSRCTPASPTSPRPGAVRAPLRLCSGRRLPCICADEHTATAREEARTYRDAFRPVTGGPRERVRVPQAALVLEVWLW